MQVARIHAGLCTVSFTENAKEFSPHENPETLYIAYGARMSDIVERAQQKWPDGYEDLQIAVEHIQTRSIGYDFPDSGDFTDYLVITRIKE
jgi:hypothetical protein